MRKLVAIIAILALAVSVMTAQKTGRNNVVFAQAIKIDTAMTQDTDGFTEEAATRWIYSDATKISKETYEIIKQAMINADLEDRFDYFQHLNEYGVYNQILHKDIYGGQIGGNGVLYVNIALSLNHDTWFYKLRYRIQTIESGTRPSDMTFRDIYMKDLFVQRHDGENEKEAIKALRDAIYEHGMWRAYKFVDEIYNQCALNDTTGFYE